MTKMIPAAERSKLMDYVKEIFFLFRCDTCGCTEDFEDRRLKDAIKEARSAGWKIGKHKNTCPSCREQT